MTENRGTVEFKQAISPLQASVSSSTKRWERYIWVLWHSFLSLLFSLLGKLLSQLLLSPSISSKKKKVL